LAKSHQQPARFLRWQRRGNGPNLAVRHGAAQTIAAQHEGVAHPQRVGPIDVHLHQRLGAKAAVNDVGRDVADLTGVDPLETGIFPDQAMVVSQLLDDAVPRAVDPAVADMGHPGAAGSQQQGAPRGAGPLELWVGPTECVDAGVGLDEGLAQGRGGAQVKMLVIRVRNDADRLLARLLADRVRTHPVRHEEQMALLVPLFRTGG
jgi:hypothetical protein